MRGGLGDLGFFIICFVFTFSAFSPLAFSQSEKDEKNDYDINIYFEDDYPGISFWGADRAYTAGERISWVKEVNDLPSWGKPFLGWLSRPDSRYNLGFAVGQQIYTPTDLSASRPLFLDEPYAGYLFVGTSLQIRNKNVLHSFELDVGVVGPPSLAAATQINFHRIFGFEPVEGWANQLHTEPTITLFYQQKNILWSLDWDDNTILDFVSNFEGAAGNLYLYAGIGAQVRLGYNLSDNFGPTVLTPVGVDSFVSPVKWKPFEAYFFVSSDARYMLRNLFLDGNSFEPSQSIPKMPIVVDYDFGFVLRFWSFKILWRQIVRSREFTPEYSPHAFASINLTYNYRF